ncbi:MAG: hypothetical protein JW967_07425 [Dehalococcoidales bacterium]|nr:hypothetical protein [Dehalococcoidales bacterium]
MTRENIIETAIGEYEKENLILKEKIERSTGKTAEQLYDEREKRVRDAIELKEPDRIPIAVFLDKQSYSGVPNATAYYDPVIWKRGLRKITLDFEPDMVEGAFLRCGSVLEALGAQTLLWPGGPLPADYDYQYIEGEYMKEDEYDMFLSDPSGFTVSRYLPRVYSALMPLAKLPPLDMMIHGFEMLTPLFASPEFIEMATRLHKAGQHMEEFRKLAGDFSEEMAQLGFPAFSSPMAQGVGGAPYDAISSFLRGMKGAMIDMFRQPDKLLKACDAIIDRQLSKCLPADPAQRGNPKKIGMPLWRGDKHFMSDAQFNKFYWPGLKRALQTNIDLGYVPMPVFEDDYGDRLERLLELPKGKVIACIDDMDVERAKKVLGGHTCLLVHTPESASVWSLREVENYAKELIDKCGKGGGVMMIIGLPDKAKTEDAQAMLKSIKEYSRY